MTKYPAWKRHQIRTRWKNIVIIFILVILFFAVLNGFLKTFSFKNFLEQGKWDGNSPFVVSLGTSTPSILVFQNDPGKLTFFSINGNNYFETGNYKVPLKNFSSIERERNGEDLAKALSLAFLAKIDNYILFKNVPKIDDQFAKNWFSDFASLKTPIEILSGRQLDNVKSTNITRIDLIRLWWQSKTLSINKVNLVDFSNLSEEIVTSKDKKVLGIDTESLNREVAVYLKNLKISDENFDIEIINASGSSFAGKLAASFIASIGGNVIREESVEDLSLKTSMAASDKNVYTTAYLANFFNCGITTPPEGGDQRQITLTLGEDFAQKYVQ